MSSRRRLPALLVGVVLCALAWAGSPGAAARTPSDVRASLDWHACADLPEDAPTTFECATVEVPRDYSRPKGRQITLALTRLPAKDAANRIGSLFFNFGGPGGDGVSSLQAISARYDPLNRRFDLVGFDPRGVGQSSPAIDCAVNQETDGMYAQPFPTPDNLDVDALVARDRAYVERCVERNADILPYVSTANVARDMDVLREAVGDSRLTYLGFSYGTTLGATYAAMFPTHFRSMVLDGAFSADQYVNQPLESLREYTAGFERALDRFLNACAAHQDACKGFGGEDPWTALDELVERANAQPLPVTGDDPRPVDGDDILAAANQSMFAKKLWPGLAKALAQAQAGDGTEMRAIADGFYGVLEDGTYDPFFDRYFAITAADEKYPSGVSTFLAAGLHSHGLFDHQWWNSGYLELNYGLYPVKPNSRFDGPFTVPDSSPTILVVGTTYDPATPYRSGRRLVRELGQARLLTMRGDGHTASFGNPTNSVCVDTAVAAYLEDHVLPPPGTTCRQEVPFVQPPEPSQPARVFIPRR